MKDSGPIYSLAMVVTLMGWRGWDLSGILPEGRYPVHLPASSITANVISLSLFTHSVTIFSLLIQNVLAWMFLEHAWILTESNEVFLGKSFGLRAGSLCL